VPAPNTSQLSDLVAGLGRLATPPWVDPMIRGLADDSRIAGPGDLFLARSGDAEVDRRHLAAAVEAGVAAIAAPVASLAGFTPARSVATVEIETGLPRAWVGLVAARFHGRPGGALAAIGVTGTNGKTTVAWLARQLLQSQGVRCGLVGTVAIGDGVSDRPASLTTPGALELQATLARMVEHGCRAAAIEVSSHALDQDRVAGVPFRVGVFTNLSGDHLDYHGSMERYAAAKRRLFESLDAGATAIVNARDGASEIMTRDLAAGVLRFAVAPEGAGVSPASVDVRGVIGDLAPEGFELRIESPWGRGRVRLPLVGRHNAENALAALASTMVVLEDVERFDEVVAALGSVTAPPGRFEQVSVPGRRFTVLVDYAHTDDALSRALVALRPLVPTGARLTVVFGCGGYRDRAKRPRMAVAACAHADRVIVTSDNPRTEDPVAIVEEVLAGVPAEARSRVGSEVDRAAAIERAVSEAEEGDIVLIAGKGHEDYQIVGDRRRDFDDRQVAAEMLRMRWREAAANH
jgi:UDP-N-acetylmuramoyl-L-alanyl-D-glutamate--2,6-diaminopimelate ligase